jgi:FKBP12-rapamycin complex-associated protein
LGSGKSPEQIKLALDTLGAFDFSGMPVSVSIPCFSIKASSKGHILNEFVRNSALPYLEDDHAEVRGAAAYACCKLFVRDPITFQASSHAIEIISDVLDKLLTVGIADPGWYII